MMNAKTVLTMAAIPALVVTFAAGPEAVAETITNNSGTICKNYDAADASYIDYLANGAQSFKTSDTSLICPLVRGTTNSSGAYVYVDITHRGTRTTSCTLFSYSDTGALLGTFGNSWTGSGYHEFVLNLMGAGKSNSWSDYAVQCRIPGGANGQIMGVDLVELD